MIPALLCIFFPLTSFQLLLAAACIACNPEDLFLWGLGEWLFGQPCQRCLCPSQLRWVLALLQGHSFCAAQSLGKGDGSRRWSCQVQSSVWAGSWRCQACFLQAQGILPSASCSSSVARDIAEVVRFGRCPGATLRAWRGSWEIQRSVSVTHSTWPGESILKRFGKGGANRVKMRQGSFRGWPQQASAGPNAAEHPCLSRNEGCRRLVSAGPPVCAAWLCNPNGPVVTRGMACIGFWISV